MKIYLEYNEIKFFYSYESSAHVHTTFCDGKTSAQVMAQSAYEMGFVSLGFTSHAPQTFTAHPIIEFSQEGGVENASNL